MATFEHVILTSQGETLLNREIAGQVQLKFSHMAFSSDDYSNTSDDEIANLTALTNVGVTGVPTASLVNNITKVRAYAMNTNLTQAFYVRTYALYVTPSDTGQEVLFGLVSTQNPDFLPAFNGTQVSQVAYTFNLKISRTEDIHFDNMNDVALTVDDLNSAASSAVAAADSYTDSRLAGAQFSQYAVLGSNVSFAAATVNGVQVADVNMLNSVASSIANVSITSLASSTNSNDNSLSAEIISVSSNASSEANAAYGNAVHDAINVSKDLINSAETNDNSYALSVANSVANNTYNAANNNAQSLANSAAAIYQNAPKYYYRGDWGASVHYLPMSVDGYWGLNGNSQDCPANFDGYGVIEQKCNDFDKFIRLRDNMGNEWTNNFSNQNWVGWQQVSHVPIQMCANAQDAQNKAAASPYPILCVYPE